MLPVDTPLAAATLLEDKKLPIAHRMAEARAAKADKRLNRAINQSQAAHQRPCVLIELKTPSNPLAERLGGKSVHRGQKGALFYVNKNGNKTYFSSNQ